MSLSTQRTDQSDCLCSQSTQPNLSGQLANIMVFEVHPSTGRLFFDVALDLFAQRKTFIQVAFEATALALALHIKDYAFRRGISVQGFYYSAQLFCKSEFYQTGLDFTNSNAFAQSIDRLVSLCKSYQLRSNSSNAFIETSQAVSYNSNQLDLFYTTKTANKVSRYPSCTARGDDAQNLRYCT